MEHLFHRSQAPHWPLGPSCPAQRGLRQHKTATFLQQLLSLSAVSKRNLLSPPKTEFFFSSLTHVHRGKLIQRPFHPHSQCAALQSLSASSLHRQLLEQGPTLPQHVGGLVQPHGATPPPCRLCLDIFAFQNKEKTSGNEIRTSHIKAFFFFLSARNALIQPCRFGLLRKREMPIGTVSRTSAEGCVLSSAEVRGVVYFYVTEIQTCTFKCCISVSPGLPRSLPTTRDK